jgi:hypothetical protein
MPGVKYRIKNADYGTFLERRRVRRAADKILLRPEKDTFYQHWIFVPIQGNPAAWRIQTVEDPEDAQYNLPKTYLVGQTTPNKVVKLDDQLDPKLDTDWMYVRGSLTDDKTYLVSSTSGRLPSMLFVDENDEKSVSIDTQAIRKPSELKDDSMPMNYRWVITQVSPIDLPEGADIHFRIRTLVGLALQLDSSGKLNTDKEDRRGSQRCWSVKDLGNGVCTIFNPEAKKYLTTYDKGSYDWAPTAKPENEVKEEDRRWIIQPTSSFTYSISVERPIFFQSEKRTQTLSLALDQGNAILKAKKAAHNQMWLIEPEDAALDVPPGGKDPKQPNEVVPGLLTGSYKFRNTDTRKFFVSFTRSDDNWVISTDTELNANKIKVEEKGKGVVLYLAVSRLKIYISVDSSNRVVGLVNNDNYVWTIVSGPQSGQYFITASNGQVLTSPPSINANFSIASQSPDASKLWQFVP